MGSPHGPDAARLTFERVLPYVDGRCQFLGDDDRCTIYDDRPANCRRFECAPGYHHAGGNIGSMYTINFYPNFAPVQELSDWFGHWAGAGTKPLGGKRRTNRLGHPCEAVELRPLPLPARPAPGMPWKACVRPMPCWRALKPA